MTEPTDAELNLIYASLKGENAALREAYTEQQALIRQLVEALEGSIAITMGKIEQRNTALIAGRAWLEGKPCA